MSELKEFLRGIVKEEMAWSKVPGVTMAIVNGDETEYLTEGFRDKEEQLPVDEETLFVIASCSKSMTTAMLGCLVDEGILSWDEPVSTYCPELKMMAEDAKDMSLRDMLLHRTGLAPHDGMWPDYIGRDVLASRLRYLEPDHPFRTGKRAYNNVIYALTAYVAECAAGKSYQQLMEEYIFKPLGMDSTFTTFDGFTGYKNIAEPYYGRNGEVVRLEKWNMDQAVAAAAIATNAKDMAKWLRFNISKGLDDNGIRILSEDSWDRIHTGGILGDAKKLKDYLSFDTYAFGWWEGTYRGFKIYKHTGKINGYSSLEIFIPDLQVGLFTSMNIHCPEDHLYYRAAYSAFDYVMGADMTGNEWKNVFRREGETPDAGYYENDLNYLPVLTDGPKSAPKGLEAYTGEYFDSGYGLLRICLEDGHLVAYHRNFRNPLDHFSGDCFKAEEFWEDVLCIKMPFEFIMPTFGEKALEIIVPMESKASPTHFRRIK